MKEKLRLQEDFRLKNFRQIFWNFWTFFSKFSCIFKKFWKTLKQILKFLLLTRFRSFFNWRHIFKIRFVKVTHLFQLIKRFHSFSMSLIENERCCLNRFWLEMKLHNLKGWPGLCQGWCRNFENLFESKSLQSANGCYMQATWISKIKMEIGK